MATPDTLWWRQPATRWLDALPLGNGRLGAKVFGGHQIERIALNLDTLWSGGPQMHGILDGPQITARLRSMMFAGDDRAEADRVARMLEGPDVEAFQPAGDLELRDHALREAGDARSYRTELDLSTGIATTTYAHDGAIIRRSVYVSNPDNCLVVQVDALEGELDLSIRLTSPHPHTVAAIPHLSIEGYAPAWIDGAACLFRETTAPPARYGDDGGVGYALALEVSAEGGQVTATAGGEIAVTGAASATIRLAGETTFDDWRSAAPRDLEPARSRAAATLAAAVARPERELRQRHVTDHGQLFDRVRLRLDSSIARDELAMDERIALVRDGGADPGLFADLFAFGRYLLIASSRPHTQAANLQGIWNESLTPPWFADWTTNINIQMNYWIAEPGGLSECVDPLIDLVQDLAEAGRVTAREVFGFGGWCANHNVDIWRTTWPVGEGLNRPMAALTPTCGIWMLAHLVDHDRFQPDDGYARDVLLPLVDGAVEFALDLLVAHPRTGKLVTSPSTSPENTFYDRAGVPVSIDYGTTFDLWLMRDLLRDYLDLGERLGVDLTHEVEARRALSSLPDIPIGPDGRIQEWSTPWREEEPEHRHLSHLYGLFPGDGIDPIETPELAEAAQRNLDVKASHGHPLNGWPHAWAAALRARLGDGETSGALLEHLVQSDKIGPGLLYVSNRGIFQIDANLGLSGAIAEMLLQSHRGLIRVLPALPEQWARGSMRGMRARGGVTVSVDWTPEAADVELTADRDGTHRVLLPGASEPEQLELRAGRPWRIQVSRQAN